MKERLLLIKNKVLEKDNFKKYIVISIFLVLLFLTIGYSAYSKNLSINNISIAIRENADIRITGIKVENSTEGVVSHSEDYNIHNTSMNVTLPKEDSSITYRIQVTNVGNTDMGIFDITGLPDYLTYTIEEYKLKDKLCDENNLCNSGMQKEFLITIKYKEGHKIPETKTTVNNIYYYHDNISYTSPDYLNKTYNHVIFGGYCWQYVRTTATGGVRLVYNGVAKDGKCTATTSAERMIGKSVFNRNYGAPGYVGYRYNQDIATKYTENGLKLFGGHNVLNRNVLSATVSYYYSDDIEIIDGKYTLKNKDGSPVTKKIWGEEYQNLKGFYTCGNESYTNCSSVYYIAFTDSAAFYSIQVSNGNTIDNEDYEIVVGQSYKKDAEVYILENIEKIKRSEWVDNYTKYKNYYVCTDFKSTSCDKLYQITDTTNYQISYYKDTLLFGSDVMYDEKTGMYTLKNPKTYFELKRNLGGYHYTCLGTSSTCKSVGYGYNKEYDILHYVSLTNGYKIDDALNEMFNSTENPEDPLFMNKDKSAIATFVDEWYEGHLSNFETYLDSNAVYCNDRSLTSYGSWDNSDSSMVEILYFGPYRRINIEKKASLACLNILDQDSMMNKSAKLDNPVGLLTSDEVLLYRGDKSDFSSLAIGTFQWLGSPYWYGSYLPRMVSIDSKGFFYFDRVHNTYGVRPAITLNSNTKLATSSGNGTPNNPYVIATNNDETDSSLYNKIKENYENSDQNYLSIYTGYATDSPGKTSNHLTYEVEEERTTFNIELNHDFRKIHTIKYTNIENKNYPTEMIDGEKLVIDFNDYKIRKLLVKKDNAITNDYTYEDYILTIPNVSGDIEIINNIENLYDAIEYEYLNNKTYLSLYDGEATDSFGSDNTDENIYYYHDNIQTEFRDADKNLYYDYTNYLNNTRNHVIFGGYCWQYVRTTNNGGVRLVYNGEAKDGKCTSIASEERMLPKTSAFNTQRDASPYVGYRHNKDIAKKYGEKIFSLNKSYSVYLRSDMSENTSYYFSDDIEIIDGDYTLKNKDGSEVKKMIWGSEYSSLEGKYTCLLNDTQNCTFVYYIVKAEPKEVYYIKLNAHTKDTLESVDYEISLGQSYKENNGIYTLENVEKVKRSEWFNNYAKYNSYYMCPDYQSINCEEIYKISNTSNYRALYYNDKIVFGTDVSYNKETKTYSLINQKTYLELERNIDGYHYTCQTTNSTCEKVYYAHNLSGTTLYSVLLTNGDKIEDALNEMFPSVDDSISMNKDKSTIATYVDEWYDNKLSGFEKYLDLSAIYCSERSISSYGGWNNSEPSMNKYLYFKTNNRLYLDKKASLVCENVVDQLSKTNEKAKLDNPIGLLTADEVYLYANGNRSNSLANGRKWWLSSPLYFTTNWAYEFFVTASGTLNSIYVISPLGVRPAITLNPNAKLALNSGNGSTEKPYIIATD